MAKKRDKGGKLVPRPESGSAILPDGDGVFPTAEVNTIDGFCISHDSPTSCHTMLTADTAKILDEFLRSFKEIRSGVVPFVIELGESWKQFENIEGFGVSQEIRSKIFVEIMQKYLEESRIAMRLLFEQYKKITDEGLLNIISESEYARMEAENAIMKAQSAHFELESLVNEYRKYKIEFSESFERMSNEIQKTTKELNTVKNENNEYSERLHRIQNMLSECHRKNDNFLSVHKYKDVVTRILDTELK